MIGCNTLWAPALARRLVANAYAQLEAAAIAAARRNNAALWYVPDSLGGVYQDSAGTTLPALNAPIGLLLDRSYGAETLGPELVANGDFANGTAGYLSASGATVSIVSGNLRVTNGTASYGYSYVNFPTVAGKTYLLVTSRKGGAPTSTVNLHLYASGSVGGQIAPNLDAANPRTFVALDAQTQIRLYAGGNTVGNYTDYGALSVREVIAVANLGPELATLTTLAGTGAATVTANAATSLDPTKTYRVSGTVAVTSGAYQWRQSVAGPTTVAASGVSTIIVSNTSVATMAWLSGNSGSVSGVSVREVLGYHATPATAANKPTLVRVPRKLGPDVLTDKSNIANGGTRVVVAAPLALGKSYVISGTLSADLRAHDNTGVFAVPANRVVSPNPAGGGLLNLYNAGAAAISIADVSIREVLEWSYAPNYDRVNDVLASTLLCGDAGTIIAAHQVSTVTGAWQAIAASGAVPNTTNKGARLRVGTATPPAAGIDVSWAATSSFVNSGNLTTLTAVQSGTWDATAVRGYLAGAFAYNTTSATGIGNGQPFFIGALNASGADAFSGAIHLLCIAQSVLPDADRIAIERFGAYLSGANYVG